MAPSGKLCDYCKTRPVDPNAIDPTWQPLSYRVLFKRDAYCAICADKINQSSRLAGMLVVTLLVIFVATMIW